MRILNLPSIAWCVTLLAGCGSRESEQPATTGAAASSTSAAAATAAATETGSGTGSALPVGPEKREMVLLKLGSITSEFGEPKAEIDDLRPKFQKVFRQLAGGKQGYCGVHTSGNVTCWGKTPSDGMGGAFVQVAVADRFLCGVDLAGALTCKPGDASPQLTASPGAPAPAAPSESASAASSGAAAPAASDSPAAGGVKYRAVYAGTDRVCALDKPGHPSCWAAEGACSIPEIPSDQILRTMAVGKCHVCARDPNEGVKCWAPPGAAVGTPPAGLVAKELIAGDGWSCALDAKGALACWGSAPAAPSDLPAELVTIGGRGGAMCAIAKGGALRCWGTFSVNKPGPYTAVTVSGESACAQVSKDKLECFGSEAENQLDVPTDSSMYSLADAGRTPEEVAAHKKRRADALKDLLAKLPARALPVNVDRATPLPVGRVTAEGFLPLLEMQSFYKFFEVNHYHDGFSVEAPDRKPKLVVMHDNKTPVLLSFGEDGKRISRITLASYEINEPEQALYDCADVIEEVAVESVIGADLKITTTKTSTLETLGRLRNADNKISNYCKVRQWVTEYAVSSSGSIDIARTKSSTVFDKFTDEGCRGRWVDDPRGLPYTARDNLSEECRTRMHR